MPGSIISLPAGAGSGGCGRQVSVCHSFAIICGICAITWIDVGGERDVTLPPPLTKGALTRNIVTAMDDGDILNVPLAPQGGDASLVLQGAGLAYAVVCAPVK